MPEAGFELDAFPISGLPRRPGVELVRFSVDEGPLAGTKWYLHTRDAHDLYRKLGFTEPSERVLERGAGTGRAGDV